MTGWPAVVAVDVGNTAIKFASELVSESAQRQSLRSPAVELPCYQSLLFNQPDWFSAMIARLTQWFEHPSWLERTTWRIAAVQHKAADQLTEQISMRFPNASIQRVRYRDVPLQTSIDQPERVGIDRLLSAFAAKNRFPTPLVIIDAGSAVTVDLVDSAGIFAGGAIFPGLKLQTMALAAGTEALPAIDWTQQTTCHIPGRNTIDAIRLGVLDGVTGAIDRLIEEYQQSIQAGHDVAHATDQRQAKVVFCGGDAQVISKRLRHPHCLLPDLVCRGLLDLGNCPPRISGTIKR